MSWSHVADRQWGDQFVNCETTQHFSFLIQVLEMRIIIGKRKISPNIRKQWKRAVPRRVNELNAARSCRNHLHFPRHHIWIKISPAFFLVIIYASYLNRIQTFHQTSRNQRSPVSAYSQSQIDLPLRLSGFLFGLTRYAVSSSQVNDRSLLGSLRTTPACPSGAKDLKTEMFV